MAAALLLFACACATPAKQRPHLRAGRGVDELPPGYALILGRLRVSVDGDTVVCLPSAAAPACALTLRRRGGGSLQVPHQSYPPSLDMPGDPEPFYVLRLPAGTYEVERFEASVQDVPERFNRRAGNAVAVQRTFTVKEGEAAYVGSLLIDLPASGSSGATVRVVEEADRAREVAAEVDPEAEERFVSRPMR